MPLNVRFGQPVRAWGEQTDHAYPAYDFPFSYARQTDPLTLRTRGILDRCSATDTCPRIFHVATSLGDVGGAPVSWVDGSARRARRAGPGECAHLHHGEHAARAGTLPLADASAFRQLPAAAEPEPADLDDARPDDARSPHGCATTCTPPESAVPRIADGTLVPADQVRFPPIPANIMAASSGRRPRPRASMTRCMSSISARSTGRRIRAASSRVEPPARQVRKLWRPRDAGRCRRQRHRRASIRCSRKCRSAPIRAGISGARIASRTACAICKGASFPSRRPAPNASPR